LKIADADSAENNSGSSHFAITPFLQLAESPRTRPESLR
jgi:hypothetical protein